MNNNSEHGPYDALLLVSFGGPDGPDDVMPFLENVLRGKPVPRERMLEVAEHYYENDGISPINEQNRALIKALEAEFASSGIDLPIYWGNRNWYPMLPEAMQEMADKGHRRVLALMTSAFGSYSGCRQYRENVAAALAETEVDLVVHKIRHYYHHPGFVEAMVDRVQQAWNELPEQQATPVELVFTAHSIPTAMAATGPYVNQLQEACRLVAEAAGISQWKLVYQSRSGPPTQPWLEPDVNDYLKERGTRQAVIVAPIGFISDHMEVMFDLDHEVAELCQEMQVPFARAGTVGTHPRFVAGLRELVQERTQEAPCQVVGSHEPWPTPCPEGCCNYVARRPPAAASKSGQPGRPPSE